MPVPTTAESIIEEALLHRLSTLVLSPVVPVAWPRTKFDPVPTSPYLRPKFVPVPTQQMALGSNGPNRHSGLFQVSVFYPALPDATASVPKGSIAPAEIAGSVIKHFKRGTIINRNGLFVRVGSADGSANVPWRSPAIEEPGWYQIPVTIPWWCDADNPT